MRTNIVLDDDLVGQAMQYATVKTKRAVVAEALATYVAVKSGEQRMRSYQARLKIVRDKLKRASLSANPASLVREDRETRR